MNCPSQYDIPLKPHKPMHIDLESFRDENDVCILPKKPLDPKVNDLGMKFLSEKLTVNPVRVHPFNSDNNNKPNSDVERMKILAKATFPKDEKNAKVLYESMHSKYLERITQKSVKKPSSIPSSTDTPQKSEEEKNILTSSLVGFIYDVKGQHVILQEDEPESPLHKIIEEIKALRIEMKNVLSKVGSELSVLTKIDINGVTNHKSFSVTAKQVKAKVVAFLKFLIPRLPPNSLLIFDVEIVEAESEKDSLSPSNNDAHGKKPEEDGNEEDSTSSEEDKTSFQWLKKIREAVF